MGENELINLDTSHDNIVPFEEIPRYEEKNLLGYDDETLARKNRELKNILKDYPEHNKKFVGDIWDVVENMTNEEWEEFKKKCQAPPIKRQQGINV